MITRRNWLLRCSIMINVAMMLYVCSQMMINNEEAGMYGQQDDPRKMAAFQVAPGEGGNNANGRRELQVSIDQLYGFEYIKQHCLPF